MVYNPANDPSQFDESRAFRPQQPGQSQPDLYGYDGSQNTSAWHAEHPLMNPRAGNDNAYQCAFTTHDGEGNTYNFFIRGDAYFVQQPRSGYDYQQNPQYDFRQYDPNYQRMMESQRAGYVPPPPPESAYWAREQQYQQFMRYEQLMGQQNALNAFQSPYQQFNPNYGQNNWAYRPMTPNYYSYGYNNGYNPGYNMAYGGPGGFAAGSYGESQLGFNLPTLSTALAGTAAILALTNRGNHGGYGGYHRWRR